MVLPLMFVLVWQMRIGRKSGRIGFTGLEYLRSRNCVVGKWRKYLRTATRSVVVIGLGLLWAGPMYRSSEPLLERGSPVSHRNFLVAFDMSPSMNLPATSKGDGGMVLDAGQGGVTRYEMARDALFAFLDRFEGERFGLILFSTEPLLARWPTVETEHKFTEVLESIRQGSGTQLAAFSALTNTDKALLLARTTFGEAFAEEDGAIILISDAEDDLENLGGAMHNIRGAGIRLYTIGVGISDEVVERLSQEFAGDPGFRIFRVGSEEEMEEAYRIVGEVEESPQFTAEASISEFDLRWLFSLILVVVAGIVIWFNEAVFHRTPGSGQRNVNPVSAHR